MRKFILFALMAAAFSMASVDAQAQLKAEVKEINVETMQTPQFSYDGESKKLPSAREWVEIEVEFEVESADRTKEFIDDVELVYYVVLKGRDGKTVMLVQQVMHVNVPVKTEIFSDVFISPSTIQKITGGKATSAGVVESVAVELRFQGGVIAGKATSEASSKWWQTLPRTEGMLLKKSDTPFAILWTDRYAEIKKES